MSSDEPGAPWGDPDVAEQPGSRLLVDDERWTQDVAVADVPAQSPGPSYDPPAPAAGQPLELSAAERDELAADRAARPLTRDGRRLRASQPARLSPARAVAGAAVSVAGVLLGIGTVLWATEDPQTGSGPVVAATAPVDTPFEQAPPPLETESVPVDPPAAVVPSPAAVVPKPAARPVAEAPSLVVPVTVLNNSNRTGLADRAAARFSRAGWPVRLTGNFRGQIPVTTVYYDPGFEANARAFADAFGGIARVRPRFATLPARGVVVVLTREFAA